MLGTVWRRQGERPWSRRITDWYPRVSRDKIHLLQLAVWALAKLFVRAQDCGASVLRVQRCRLSPSRVDVERQLSLEARTTGARSVRAKRFGLFCRC